MATEYSCNSTTNGKTPIVITMDFYAHQPSIITYQIILNMAQSIQSDSKDVLADVYQNIRIIIIHLVSKQQTYQVKLVIQLVIQLNMETTCQMNIVCTLTTSTRRQITYVEPALDSLLNTATRGTSNNNDIKAVNNSSVVVSIGIQTQGIDSKLNILMVVCQ